MHRFSCCTWRRHLTPNNTVRNVATMHIMLFLLNLQSIIFTNTKGLQCSGYVILEVPTMVSLNFPSWKNGDKNCFTNTIKIYSVFMYLMDKNQNVCYQKICYQLMFHINMLIFVLKANGDTRRIHCCASLNFFNQYQIISLI